MKMMNIKNLKSIKVKILYETYRYDIIRLHKNYVKYLKKEMEGV